MSREKSDSQPARDSDDLPHGILHGLFLGDQVDFFNWFPVVHGAKVETGSVD